MSRSQPTAMLTATAEAPRPPGPPPPPPPTKSELNGHTIVSALSGSGWVCETHPTQPIAHHLEDGSACGGAGFPCEEPGCPFTTHQTSADVARKKMGRKPYAKSKGDRHHRRFHPRHDPHREHVLDGHHRERDLLRSGQPACPLMAFLFLTERDLARLDVLANDRFDGLVFREVARERRRPLNHQRCRGCRIGRAQVPEE